MKRSLSLGPVPFPERVQKREQESRNDEQRKADEQSPTPRKKQDREQKNQANDTQQPAKPNRKPSLIVTHTSLNFLPDKRTVFNYG